MTDDAERREVARNIRENYVCGGLGYKVASAYNIAVALGMNPGLLVGDIELWNRLADLIEPAPSCEFWDVEGQECYSIRTVQPVDRDALMALAEEMVEMLRLGAFTGEGLDAKWCRELHDSYGRRIRKACGEEAKDES